MRRSEMYRRIGLAPEGWNCSEKERYSAQADAAKASLAHRRRISVCFGVNEYWCREHQCWHWGHTDNHRVANRIMWESLVWFIAWQDSVQARHAIANSK